MPSAKETLPDLSCACATARRASRLVTQLYSDHLRESSLEPTQFALLTALKSHPGKSQVVFGKALGLDKTTLSRNLKLLQKNGWVKTARVEGQRELGFFVTPAGLKLVNTATPAWQQAQEHLRSTMTDAEWKKVWDGLSILTRAAGGARKN